MAKRILIIEDDQAIAEIERDYLELRQFEVTIDNDGGKGVELAINQAYERLRKGQTTNKGEADIQVGHLLIQPGSHRVFVHNEEVNLKNKEYELLLFLVRNGDLVFDKETLYERIWGLEAIGDVATVAVHINRLREKIEDDPSNPRYIETVWGAGYRFKM